MPDEIQLIIKETKKTNKSGIIIIINNQQLPPFLQKACVRLNLPQTLVWLDQLSKDKVFQRRLNRIQETPVFKWHQKTFLSEFIFFLSRWGTRREYFDQLLEKYENRIFGPPGVRATFKKLLNLKRGDQLEWKQTKITRISRGKYLVERGKVEVLVDFEEELDKNDWKGKWWEYLKQLLINLERNDLSSYGAVKEVWVEGKVLPEKATIKEMIKEKLIDPSSTFYSMHKLKQKLLEARLKKPRVTLQRTLANGITVKIQKDEKRLILDFSVDVSLRMDLTKMPESTLNIILKELAEILAVDSEIIYRSYMITSKIHDLIEGYVDEIYIGKKRFAGDRAIVVKCLVENVPPQIKALLS